VIAAYSVVGEREQGTLEPLLTSPVSREELLLGKAIGVVVPAVGMAYLLFTAVQVCARLFASNAAVVSDMGQGPHILAEILFAPLLAGWSIWVGIGISTRASDVRVAQQLGTLSSIPPPAVVALGPSMCSPRVSPSQSYLQWSCSWPTSFCFASSRPYSTARDSSQALGLSDRQVLAATFPHQVQFDRYRA
jgi:ABC-type Na+ efflux pump permease subunit